MKLEKIIFLGILFLFVVSLSACGNNSGGIEVFDVWARPGLSSGNSAVFFVIENHGESMDRLLSAHSDIAETVELHKSSMVDGVMKMEMQPYIDIGGGDSVVFKPGDFHVMLIGLHDDLAAGDQFTVLLNFETAGEKVVDVKVREP